MKVVLIKNVENLGITGDAKEVKNGYARNFLIPQKLAVVTCDPNAKDIIAKAKAEREKVTKEIEEIKKIALDLSGKAVEISAKSGENGKLFGSVTAELVAKELKLNKKMIEMEPVKSTGDHNVVLDFGHGIKTNIKITVKPLGEKQKKSK